MNEEIKHWLITFTAVFVALMIFLLVIILLSSAFKASVETFVNGVIAQATEVAKEAIN